MRARLARDFERFGRALPRDWAAHVREAYGVDLTARYLGATLPHPIGKASGQLSLNAAQLEGDAAAGLAFTVLKTVIAEDVAGSRSMEAWAVPESRMVVERRRSTAGRGGWTVTWKGRGWDRTLDDYLALVRAGRDVARDGRLLVVPSAKFHLPALTEPFRDAEYGHTAAALARAWGEPPLLIEQDFSPTLAGDVRAADRASVLRWLRESPEHIRAASPGVLRLAVKLMNARFDDAFQVEMMRAAVDGGADALVVFNRLFDPEHGVAYGGWDLSDRNLRALDLARSQAVRPPLGLSATGNVCSGRQIVAYARRGAESVQVHTYFQLPLGAYAAAAGTKVQRALHALVFDPEDGLVAALLDLEEQGVIGRREGELHFLDVTPRAD